MAAAVTAVAAAAVAGVASAGAVKPADEDKKVTRLYWSYGDDLQPLSRKSRFYVDLNLHVETENYAAGEAVEVDIANDDGSDIVAGLPKLKVKGTVAGDGTAVIKNVFSGKTVDISASA